MIEILRDQEKLCEARVANGFFSRLFGLMFKKELPTDEGLLIEYSPYFGSKAVHGFFMRFPLDLIFLSKDKKVVDTAHLKPWSIYNPKKECRWVLEVEEGFVGRKGIKKGDVLSF
ncbi:MAG: DUF192 domain-containing protein, partial [Candidatus Hydrothermarchaeales archaeon]